MYKSGFHLSLFAFYCEHRQCEDFATALLDQVRSSDELEVVLNHDAGSAGIETGKRMNLSRLKMAIRCKQKKVSPIKMILSMKLDEVSLCLYVYSIINS